MVRDKLEKKGYLASIAGGVVLTGGGALLSGAVDLAQEVFGSAARVGRPTGVKGLDEHFQQPDMATAVGLVQFAVQDVDLSSIDPGKQDRDGVLSAFGRWFRNFFE